MASTIILKNGTGSAVPSSLTHGELAINVSNGHLFYGTSGSNNSVSSSFTFNSISSSGTITANGVKVDSAVTFGGNKRIIFNSTDENIVVQDSSFKVNNHITASGNISASGTGSFGYIQMNDGKEIAFGNSQDLRIFHDGSHSRIKDGGTGQIKIQGGTAVNIISPADESMGVFTANGGVDLYFNNQKKFEVETGGVNVTGHVTASGNISASGTLTVKNNKFFKSTETVANHQGDVVFFGSGTNFTPGTIRHYKSDGSWEIADADASSTSDGLLAVALATAPSGGMLLRGTVTLNHDPGAVGDVLYLSTTGGRATSTAPSGNTDIVRIIGYCLDASNGQIWFNPDNTFVEVNA